MSDRSTLVSASDPDWSREALAWFERASGKRLLAAIRRYQRNAGNSPWRWVGRRLSALQHRFWTAVCSSDIPLNCEIGGGLLLPHPYAIVIHPGVRIGPNCLIFQGVTIGTRENHGAPRIGGHVDIGAGAKILGDVTIGDHAVIGANAVVLTDVPAHATAVGVPARIKLKDS